MKNIKYILLVLVISTTLLQTSCTTKEYTDPSTISDAQVVSTDGLLGLCNGLQLRYTVGRQSPTYQGFSASGLLTGEQKVLNVGNTDEIALLGGGASVTPGNSITTGLWTQSFLMITEANRVLDNVNVTSNANIQAVFVSYGSIYKALAIGTLATYFEKMPVTLGRNQPFVSREDALKQAVVLLESAEKSISSATVPADVTAKLVAGLDLKSTIIAKRLYESFSGGEQS
jgi:starch-binding outer membrane protein, SusD/RagB family